MGKYNKRKRSATPEQIERVKNSLKNAMAIIYNNFMLDCAVRKALTLHNIRDVMSKQNWEYVEKVITIHANITDSLLCLCTLLLCNFKAQEPIEKKFVLRKIVVICHELYKYIYGFTTSQTDWKKIVIEFKKKYPEECDNLKIQGDRYLKKYGQSEDLILRNVSNHYSDNPFEFFQYISAINEKGQTDRALLMLSIAQPLSMLLMKELGTILPKRESSFTLSQPIEPCLFKDIFNDTLIEHAHYNMNHRKEVVRSLVQKLKKCETFASQYGYDMTKDKRWRLLKDDNIVLHVMYLQLDTMILSLAMNRTENSLEEKILLAYMIASMHEGFKKIYGFTSNAHKESLWHRYAVSRQDYITDIRLNADIRMISGVLETFAKQDYLNNPTVALFLSHVGYVKYLKGDSADAMANYLLKEDYKIELAGIIKVLSFLNVLVSVSGKLLSYENDVMGQEKTQELENHLNEIDKIEKKALLRIHNEKDKQELKTQTIVMKNAIRKLYNWE